MRYSILILALMPGFAQDARWPWRPPSSALPGKLGTWPPATFAKSAPRVCAIPLLNVTNAPIPDSARMPVIRRSQQTFSSREIVPPAPPCNAVPAQALPGPK